MVQRDRDLSKRACCGAKMLSNDIVIEDSAIHNEKSPTIRRTHDKGEMKFGSLRVSNRSLSRAELKSARILLRPSPGSLHLNAPHRATDVINNEYVISDVDLWNGDVVAAQRELSHDG